MRVIGYTRISSNSAEQLHALEQHKARLKAAGCTEIYWDIASRSKDDRQGLNIVLEAIAQKVCEKAVFIRIDRMTDSPTVLERAISLCLESEVPIVGIDDNIDFETVGGRLQARILCNLARAEVERLSERTKNGYRYRRGKNLPLWPPFGYKKVGNQLELNQDPYICLIEQRQELSQADVALDLIEIYLREKTLAGTLRQFNEKYGIQRFTTPGRANRKPRKSLGFTPTGLMMWLTNPILRGHTVYGRSKGQLLRHQKDWDIRYHTHPEQVLITEKEYQAIEANLKKGGKENGYKPPKEAKVNPLSGLVYCAECRSYCKSIPYRLAPDDVMQNYYQCKDYGVKACAQKRTVKGDVIEEAIIGALTKRAEEIREIAAAPVSQEESLELRHLQEELEFYQNAPGNRAQAIVADIQQQMEVLSRAKGNDSLVKTDQRDLLLQVFRDPLYWKTLLHEQKREVYSTLVERILIREGQVVEVKVKV